MKLMANYTGCAIIFWYLINFLHSGSILGISLKRRHLGIISGSINISGVLQAESGAKKSSLEEKENEILDGLVVLVSLGSLSEVLNDAVVGVNLQMLLGGHVAHGGGVTKSLSLHDPLHIGGPTILRSDNTAWRTNKSA